MASSSVISVHGEALRADPLGALFWTQQETLIVSDLHFEKGSSFARRGIMLPPFDTRTTLTRLEALMRRYQPRRVISLGDAFHDRDAEARIETEDADRLETLTKASDWIWILGNHDPDPPARFHGTASNEEKIDALVFRHEPNLGSAPGEIAGHLHPCARVLTEGRALRRRCFASDSERLIMPAMGAFTGGLNVLDEAFGGLFSDPLAWVMGAEGVYPVARAHLAADTGSRARSRAS